MVAVPIVMPAYRGVQYIKDTDGLWKVIHNEITFVVALDDSKMFGTKNIVWSRNNQKTCEQYIDWILQDRQ